MRIRHSSSLLVLLVSIIFSSALAMAQPWTPIGPNGGDARSLAIDPKNPDRVFAGTSSGEIFVSSDSGRTWERFARIGVGEDYVLDHIAIDPHDGTMYVAGWTLMREGGALFRSRDGGKKWDEIKDMSGKSIRAMSIAPSDPKTIVVGALDGVFRSNDGGDSWEHISPANYAELKNVESIAIDPADANVIYAGTWHLPWKTTDGGKTWHNIKNGVIDDSDVFSIIIDPKQPSVVYASACSGIYKSDSAGELFKKVQGIPYTARRTRVLRQDPIRRDVVYAGTTEGLWKTSDAGKSWQRMTEANVIVNDVLIDPRNDNDVMLATDRSGILFSNNAGDSFSPSNDGYTHRQVASLVVSASDPATIYAGLLNDKEYGGVFMSRDLGATWKQISTGLGGRDVFVLRETTPGELIAGTNSGIFTRTGDGVWTSSDVILEKKDEHVAAHRLKSGRRVPARTLTREIRTKLTARVNDISIAPERWLAATDAGLFVSTDHGHTWSGGAINGVKQIVAVAARGETVIAVDRSVAFVSEDGGVHWAEQKLPNVTTYVTAAIAPDNSLWIAAREAAFRSTDNGKNWTYLWSLPSKQINFLSWDEGMGKMLATGFDSTELYESKDGSAWSKLDAGWLLRAATSVQGRPLAATAFDGVVMQGSGGAAHTSSLR